jgi:hypothetical protein
MCKCSELYLLFPNKLKYLNILKFFLQRKHRKRLNMSTHLTKWRHEKLLTSAIETKYPDFIKLTKVALQGTPFFFFHV